MKMKMIELLKKSIACMAAVLLLLSSLPVVSAEESDWMNL